MIAEFCGRSKFQPITDSRPGNLKKENFKVKEEGSDAAIDNFYFTGNASGHRLDLAVVFDDTGSMQSQIDAMKAKVKDLTDTIKASGINANYSLVAFKDSVSVKTNWTNDPEVLRKSVDALSAYSGNDEPEVALDAIEAVLSMGFRTDAQKVILAITDAHAHHKDDGSGFSKYTKDQIEKDLKGQGVIFIPVSPTFDKPTGYVDLREIANEIQSIWIDTKSADFSAILEQFKGILTGNYVIEYTSPDQTTFGNRNVTVTVGAPGCVEDSDSSLYDRPGRANAVPIIKDLVAAQDKGTVITWTANASDPDGDPVLYRFFLNNKSMTEWSNGNKWTLNATDADVGENQVEVQIRDGKHKGPDGYDDAKSVQFKLSSMKLMVQTWERTFGGPGWDEAFSVQETSDGGYIVAGRTKTGIYDDWSIHADDKGNIITEHNIQIGSPGAGGFDVWVIKTDANGNKLWDKTFGGPRDDEAYSVQQTIDGGYIITGKTQSYGSGYDDVWLINTDSSGNEIWNRTFGGPDFDGGNSVKLTSDGGYVVAGYTGYDGKKGAEVWLIKTNSQGNKLWDKTFGGYASSWSRCVQQTSDGGFVITGAAQKWGSETADVWLIKTDSKGNKLWDRTFGRDFGIDSEVGVFVPLQVLLDEPLLGDFGIDSEVGVSVQQTDDGGYIVLGFKYSSLEGSIWLIKTDSKGNKLWDRTFLGALWVTNERSVQQTNDEGYIVTGFFGTNASLIKINSQGNEEWNRTFKRGVNNWGNSVQQTNDGGFIIAGLTDGILGSKVNDEDIWLIKTDANGNV
jgi:hypothetical protein